jgi:hypothetical protein
MPFEIITTDEKQALDTVLVRLRADEWQDLDQIEEALEQMDQQHIPLRHIFTPGMYTRECFIPKGTVLITRMHLKEHPFVVLKGEAAVWTAETGWMKLTAPHLGVTQPGTRRLIYAKEDVVWATSHVTDKIDPDEVIREVTYSEGKYAALGAAKSSAEDLFYNKPVNQMSLS